MGTVRCACHIALNRDCKPTSTRQNVSLASVATVKVDLYVHPHKNTQCREELVEFLEDKGTSQRLLRLDRLI